MEMAWFFLILAGVMEMIGVVVLKYTQGLTRLIPTLIWLLTLGLSFYFMSLSLTEIPVGTAYGIWTGIGAAGAVVMGMLFFKERKSVVKVLLVGASSSV